MEVENTMQKLINVVCTNLKQFYNPAYSMFCVVYLSGKSWKYTLVNINNPESVSPW